MSKIVFFFGGTGNTAEDLSEAFESLGTFEAGVTRVYLPGPAADLNPDDIKFSDVSNVIEPNLDTIPEILRSCFIKDDNGPVKLDLGKLREDLKAIIKLEQPVVVEPNEKTNEPLEVTDIGLYGFSRGGISAFSSVRHLNDLGIEMDLIADHPVPGDSNLNKFNPLSEAYKNSDLSQCNNLRNARVLLGRYSTYSDAYFYNSSQYRFGFFTRLLQRQHYKQLLPHFPDETETKVYEIPAKNHLEFNDDCSLRLLTNKPQISVILTQWG